MRFSFKINIGNYVIEIIVIDEGDVYRVTSLFITKISDLHDGMLLSEWLSIEMLNKLIYENITFKDIKPIVYSKQPRKRLRRFHIK